MINAINEKQRGRPFKPGMSGNPRGRPKGSRNKRTAALVEASRNGGEMPLDYMLRVMRDPTVPAKRRDEMAKAAAPFLHSKMATTENPRLLDKPDIKGFEVCFVVPPSRFEEVWPPEVEGPT